MLFHSAANLPEDFALSGTFRQRGRPMMSPGSPSGVSQILWISL